QALHELMFWDHLQSHAAWAMIHGATVMVGGKRLLLIGDKGQGKSTLALYLLTRGHAVEGDEHLAVGNETVFTRPRALRIKPGTLALMQGLPEAIYRAPRIETWDGLSVHAVDPSLFGRPWRIAEGRLDAAV